MFAGKGVTAAVGCRRKEVRLWLTCGAVMEQILANSTWPERAKMMKFLNEVNHMAHSKSAVSCKDRTKAVKGANSHIYGSYPYVYISKCSQISLHLKKEKSVS